MTQGNFLELPSNWLGCTLGDVIDYGSTQKADVSSINNDTWVLELEDIEKQSSKVLKRLTFEARQSKSSKNKFEKGDVLYGKLRPYLNKVVIADDSGVCSSEIIPIRCDDSFIDSRYMFNWLKSSKFLAYVDEVSYGVNMPRLGTKDGKKAPFILAPLLEQKRIVEKLDSLFAQVDTIQQHLNNLPDIIKRFRQSVLAAAVSGKLTEQWREINEVNDWKTLAIGDISTFQNGFAFKSGWFADSGKYQVIKLGNVKDDYLKLEKSPAFINSDIAKEYIKYKPNVGDILISMTGTKYKGDYGYVCRVNEDLPILINQRVGRIVAKPDLIDSNFLLQYMRSELFRVEFLKGETGGVNQGNVGTKHIQSCPIGIPSLKEQTEIVRLVEQYFALADTLEKNLANAKQRVDNLTQSILAKAFRGELVPQDPNDEPADKLLARIKAARLEAEKLEKAAKKAAKASKK